MRSWYTSSGCRSVWKYFSELEQAIFDEALGEDECTRQHVQNALQKLNADLPEAKVQSSVIKPS